jgi:glycosyltransferase involved in cell wall biosynthesis
LRVEHLATLPAGWLGKNHALHFGAQQARGDWLLFTDADIHFQPDALRRAVAYAEAAGRDHLSVAPQLHERGALLGICVGTFSLLFAIFVRPWRIPDPCSAAHGGVGAFNLVRAATYRRVGGHAPIALRPDDDLMLGKLIKRHGGHSELLLGAGMLTVEWYASVGQMIAGLTKNAFAGVDYRVSMILGAILVHAVFWLWPVAGLFALSGVAAACNAGAVVLMLAVAVDNTRFTGGRWWHGLALPLGLVVLDWILWRSMWVTLRDDGITWRGTHYPLRALKANRL